MHEGTFRKAAEKAGINPYLCEMANIREQCSWVHPRSEETTQKAIDIVRTLVEKVKRDTPLFPIKVPVTKTALVIGGGIAGIQAALDIANAGHQVIMVEKSSVHRRAHVPAFRNISHPGLFTVHPHAPDG